MKISVQHNLVMPYIMQESPGIIGHHSSFTANASGMITIASTKPTTVLTFGSYVIHPRTGAMVYTNNNLYKHL